MKYTALLVFLALVCAVAARPDVVDSSAGGFTVKTTLAINAVPDEVYRKLVRNVGEWWNSAHTFSRDAHNLSIEEKPMGCFCEKLPNQGGVRHMEVLAIAPGKELVMSGAIGPMQPLAATGTMRIQLSAADGGTKLEVRYTVAGYLATGMNTWAAPADSVVTEQFTRLKNYIEHGSPEPK
jgi:uncharacterized protein YndB with AHSA1/START domain